MRKDKKPFDFWIFMTVLILLALGTIMVFSSSTAYSYTAKGDIYYFLKKQLVVLPLALGAMIFFMNFDYKRLAKLSPIILAVSIFLMVIVLIPGIGLKINNARRWIGYGSMTIQPSEIAKMAIILFFSYSLSKRRDQLKYFFKGLVPYLMIIGIFAVLLLMEPHLSGTVVIVLVACVILFAAGAKISHFVMLSLPAFAGVLALIIAAPYRMSRLTTFLDPFHDPTGESWQIINSLYAIGSGGLFGRGLGKSMQKFLYLPEPYNDFILAVLAEELGFIGVVVVMLLFLIFIWRGIKVSMNAPDVFGSLTATGITALIGVQFLINIAVVTSSMPVTGMPLPFFSYGGTSLIFLMANVGILLNISRYSNYERL